MSCFEPRLRIYKDQRTGLWLYYTKKIDSIYFFQLDCRCDSMVEKYKRNKFSVSTKLLKLSKYVEKLSYVFEDSQTQRKLEDILEIEIYLLTKLFSKSME